MEEISSEISNKYAILIDSENVSAKYIESIFDELSRLNNGAEDIWGLVKE